MAENPIAEVLIVNTNGELVHARTYDKWTFELAENKLVRTGGVEYRVKGKVVILEAGTMGMEGEVLDALFQMCDQQAAILKLVESLNDLPQPLLLVVVEPIPRLGIPLIN